MRCAGCGRDNDDRSRFCAACGTPLQAPAPAESRKVVTVVQCDVTGSTALGDRLDPELFSLVMRRYFAMARQVLERHGGSVQKLIGDAVVAIFGIPELHEDDALRATRAAAELRDRLPQLNEELDRERGVRLEVRIGVNTGEVVADQAGAGQPLAAGEVTRAAAALERAAPPGEVLIGAATWQLARDALRVEEVAPVTVEGVPEPVRAYRLVEVVPGAPARLRRLDVPMIGREAERALLGILFDRVVTERSCHLVTVYGDAGVGKSRLVNEFVRGLDGQALVLMGHCLPYGEKVTYWPMIQMVRRAAGIEPTDPPATVQARLASLVGAGGSARTARRVARVLGAGEGAGAPGDAFLGLRELLELLARRQPLVLVVDDLQWAEPTLLDLIEYLAIWVSDAPLMIVCLARPELLDSRAAWMGGRPNVCALNLSPLREPEAEEHVANLLGNQPLSGEVRRHLAEVGGGNPLFVEEFVAMLIEEGLLRMQDGRWVATADLGEVQVPPSVQALLAARLDRLAPLERTVIERAAVVGEEFHTADILALSPDQPPSRVREALTALLRKELIGPGRSSVPLPAASGEGYCFRHMLLREAAYQLIAKEARAELHERYASFLERAAADRLEQFNELIAYHLDQAYRYRLELGPLSDQDRVLARRAGERLAAAGHHAALRGDVQATVQLLTRAIELLDTASPARREALLELADGLREAGELQRARELYTEAGELATTAGDRGHAMHALLGHLEVLWFSGLQESLDVVLTEIRRAIQAFEALGDDLGLAKAWRLRAHLNWAMGKLSAASEDIEHALRIARRAGDERWEARIQRARCFILYWGPAPLEEVVRANEEALEWARATDSRSLEATALAVLACAAAMQERFDEARELVQAANTITKDLGELLNLAGDSIHAGFIESLAGDLGAAEKILRAGCQTLETMGGLGLLASVMRMLARVLVDQGHTGEAAALLDECWRYCAEWQHPVQSQLRGLRAVVLARQGNLQEAERLAREATVLAGMTEQPESQAEVWQDVAEVLRLASKAREAAEALQMALRCYEAKGNLAAAKRVRSSLQALRPSQ